MGFERAGLAAVCTLACACGRIGFGLAGEGTGSDANQDAPADAAGCVGATARLPMDTAGAGTWVTALRAARTLQGFSLTYIAPDAVAFGLTYAVTAGIASAVVADTTVEPAMAVQVGSATLGNLVMVVSETTGLTRVRPYNGTLGAMGAGLARPGRHALDRSLAATPDDAVVALLSTGVTPEVDGSIVTVTGADAGGATSLISAAEAATAVTLVPGGPGFILTWLQAGTVRTELLSRSLAIMAGPTSLPSVATAFQPATAWASAQGRGLVAWQQNGAIWAIRIDPSLTPVGTAMMLAASGSAPRVASDGNSFWVVWHDLGAASLVAGAHVTTGGQVTPFPLTGSGGMEVDHDVVTLRDGTVEVVWFERGGVGEPLWVIPACSLGT